MKQAISLIRGYILVLWIAWRYRTSVRRGLRWFINKVATVGLALGVAALIIGLSAMNGFEVALQQRILALVPQGEVVSINGRLAAWQPLAEQLLGCPGIVEVNPYVQSVALAEKGSAFKAIQIRGIDSTQAAQGSLLSQYITPARAWQDFSQSGAQLLLGQGVANHLGLQVGEWITVTLPDPEAQQGWRQPKRLRIQLIGLVKVGSQLDHSIALVPLALLQRQLGLGEQISGLALQVASIFQAERVLQQAAEQLHLRHPDLRFQSWMVQYGHLYRDIQMVRGMIDLAMLLVIGLACLNITTTLLLTLKQRQGDLAILATLGAAPNFLSRLFIGYGLLNGVVGGLLGVVIGVGVSLQLTPIVRGLEQLFHHHFLPNQLYFIDYLPTQVRWQDSLQVFGVALLLSLLASWYPAYHARQRDPVLFLRG
jgi:lipoprotein-releasing system permease protein